MRPATIAQTDMKTGEVRQLVLNETLQRGDRFRLIGSNIEFVAFRVWDSPMGLMVYGASVCGTLCTTARVCDTAAL